MEWKKVVLFLLPKRRKCDVSIGFMDRRNQRERQRKIKGKRWWGWCTIYKDKKKEKESGVAVESLAVCYLV